MNYDDILPHLGNFGSYQRRNYVLLCLPIILCAFHKLAGVFLLATPDHRCQLEGEWPNATYQLPVDILNISYPYDNIKHKFAQCEYFTDNYYASNESSHDIRSCNTNYVWETTKHRSSAVKSFELVCDRAPIAAAADSLLMVGVFLGSFAFGHLSDKYGRKRVFVISLICQLTFGFLTAITPEFISYAICRMVSIEKQLILMYQFDVNHAGY